MPDWVVAGWHEYARRLPRDCALHLVEIPAGKRGKSMDTARVAQREAEQMLAVIAAHTKVIALTERGKLHTTQEFALKLATWRDAGDDLALLVGGPEGLAPACLARADYHWSLSPLTFPHPLVRVIIAEQVYRAWTILHNHPYHRD